MGNVDNRPNLQKKRVNIQGEGIEQVEQFVYIGGLANADGSNEKYLQKWIGSTSQAFETMTRIPGYEELTKKAKRKTHETMIQPIFLYGSECRRIRKQDLKKILTTEMSWLLDYRK